MTFFRAYLVTILKALNQNYYIKNLEYLLLKSIICCIFEKSWAFLLLFTIVMMFEYLN